MNSKLLKKILLFVGSAAVVALLVTGIVSVLRNRNVEEPKTDVEKSESITSVQDNIEDVVVKPVEPAKDDFSSDEDSRKFSDLVTVDENKDKELPEEEMPSKKADKYDSNFSGNNSGNNLPASSDNSDDTGASSDSGNTPSDPPTEPDKEPDKKPEIIPTVKIVDSPAHVTATVSETAINGYSFAISGYEPGCIESFVKVTGNEPVEYSINGSNVIPVLEKGQSYCVKLSEDSSAYFVINGVAQSPTVKNFNILTEKAEVMNLSLGDVKFIEKESVTNLKGNVFDGLFGIDLDGNGNTNTNAKENHGSFEYKGENIKVGDTVAIYSGVRPDLRDLSTLGTSEDGDVAYVMITDIDGELYSFRTAEAKEVLMVPDVLPVSVNEDKDGDSENHSVTVSAEVFDYSDERFAEIGLDARTKLEVGDFLALYTGNLENGAVSVYGKVTGITEDGDDITVKYSETDFSEVKSSMDIYSNREVDIDLDDDLRRTLALDIEKQAIESGFFDEAAEYLTALALETKGFKELRDDLDLDLDSYNIQFANEEDENKFNGMMLMDNDPDAKITEKDVHAVVSPKLLHFEDATGVRLELMASFKVIVGDEKDSDHIEIALQATFEEEVLIELNASGGAVWKTAWIIPYIADYELSAGIDVGTFTCVGVTATCKTVAGKDEFKWENVSNTSSEEAILDIGKQITDLMEQKDAFFGEKLYDEDGNELNSATNGGSLEDKYAAFIESSGESWIKLVEKEIFSIEGSVDPLHILVYGIKTNFVVQANLYITVGATMEAGEANRYSFTVKLFSAKASSDTLVLEEPHFSMDFYVFGTAGVKVGLELEVGVGLFTLSLDSVGVSAEAGIYADFWGYYYMHYSANAAGVESSMGGALLMEIGAYLEIKFKAQLFSNDDLTYEPTLYENQWPILTLGEAENIFDFDISQEAAVLDAVLVCQTTYSLPDKLFDMKYMNLQDGKQGIKNYNDDKESHYDISLTNSKFKYDASRNMIYLDVKRGSTDSEECEMTINWNDGPLAFSTNPISRKVKIKWTDPENVRYIVFDSMGGSTVKAITGASGTSIKAPENPAKLGYVFEGWYCDREYTKEFMVPDILPNYEEGGITVYAKWSPATDTPFVVNHYKQNLNGTYSLVESVKMTGTTDTTPFIQSLTKEYAGFEVRTYKNDRIRPDHSTSIDIYYSRKTFSVKWNYGAREDGSENTVPIISKAKFGEDIHVPVLHDFGYEFLGFEGVDAGETGYIPVSENAVYTALWKPADDTPYTVIHYLRMPDSEKYEEYSTVPMEGTTDSIIDINSLILDDAKLVYKYAMNGSSSADNVKISADGNTIIRIYYDRTEYKLNFIDKDAAFTDAADVVWGGKLLVPSDVKKTGYVFNGWYKDKELTQPVDISAEKMPVGEFTLYMGWDAADGIQYKVEYYAQNADDDDYSLYDSENFLGKTGDLVSAVYKDFDGLIAKKDYQERVETGEILADGSLVLKIYYTRKNVTISFDANGGTLGSDGKRKTFRYGQLFNVEAPTKEDYAFDGWFIDDAKYDGKTVDSYEDFELKAQWIAGQVNFNVEHYIMNTDGEYEDTPTYVDQTLHGIKDSEIILSDYVNSDYEVENGIVYKEAKFDGDVATTAVVSRNMTIKLYYMRKSYSITWDFADGNALSDPYMEAGTYYYGKPIVAPKLKYTGHKFKWEPELPEKLPAQDSSFTAVWEPVSYRVVFNGGDGAEGSMVDQVYLYNELKPLSTNAFTKRGHTFLGWALTSTGPVMHEDGKAVANLSAEDGTVKNLYAVWEKDIYDVVYDLAGGTLPSGTDYQDYSYGEGFTLPIPTRQGYNFLGWYDNSLFAGNAVTAISNEETGEKHFYARWERIEYIVTWDVNGGNALSGDDYTKTGFYGDSIIAPSDPEYTGNAQYSHVFQGWFTLEEGGSKVTDFGTISDNVTYYAHWETKTNQYLITWELNGFPKETELANYTDPYTGKGGVKADYNETIIAPGCIESYRDSDFIYDFEGWYTNCIIGADGKYQKGTDSVKFGANIPVTQDETYYAIWEQRVVEYMITWFAGDDARITSDTYTCKDGFEPKNTDIVAPTSVEKDKTVALVYTFKGWYTNPSGGTRITNFGKLTGDVTYYAQYEAKEREYEVTYVCGDKSIRNGIFVKYNNPIPEAQLPGESEKEHNYNSTDVEWYLKDESGSFSKYDFSTDKVMGDSVLYAKVGYGFSVMGVDVDSLTCEDVLGDKSVTYDPATHTVEFAGGEYKLDGQGRESVISSEAGVNLNILINDHVSFATINAYTPAKAISMPGGNVCIVGKNENSRLSIQAFWKAPYAENSGISRAIFLDWGNLSIKNCRVDVVSGCSIRYDAEGPITDPQDNEGQAIVANVVSVDKDSSLDIVSNGYALRVGELNIENGAIVDLTATIQVVESGTIHYPKDYSGKMIMRNEGANTIETISMSAEDLANEEITRGTISGIQKKRFYVVNNRKPAPLIRAVYEWKLK